MCQKEQLDIQMKTCPCLFNKHEEHNKDWGFYLFIVESEFHPSAYSQTSSTGRRIVTSTSSAGGRGGAIRMGTGIRRVVTAGPTASTNQDLPTVQLCDLPSNLTLSDINQMVADAGVGQPMVSI